MPKNLIIAAAVSAIALAAGATSLGVPTALAQGSATPAASGASVTDEAVAEQSRKRKRKSSAKSAGTPPRGSKSGSNSGE